MTIDKLSAGSGYEYLTRQVAALDSTEKGATPLADHYSAKGESPGRWVGSGLVGVDGLDIGYEVTRVRSEVAHERFITEHGASRRTRGSCRMGWLATCVHGRRRWPGSTWPSRK